MVRYLRLYLCFVRFSFTKALQFRLDFFFRVAMDAVWYAVNLGFFGVLYAHTSLLGGWTESQAFVFAAGVFLADALHMTVFANNMWWLPIFVNRGDLDYHLVRPVSSLFFLSTRDFAANSLLNVVLAAGILAVTLGRYPDPLPAERVVLYLALLLAGVLIQYSLHLLFLIPVFWTHSAHGLRELYYAFERFAGRPHGVYGGLLRRILVSILPFSLIASYPTRALFEGFSPSLVLHVVGVAAASLVVVSIAWRLGLRAYASASS